MDVLHWNHVAHDVVRRVTFVRKPMNTQIQKETAISWILASQEGISFWLLSKMKMFTGRMWLRHNR
jgi:hypothetical protein